MPESESDKIKEDIYRLTEDDVPPLPRPVTPPSPREGAPQAEESSAAPRESAVPAESSSARAAESGGSISSSEAPSRPSASPEAILLESAAIVDCPSCGAPMPGEEEVVCLRCGFDLSAARKIEVRTGVEEVEPAIPEEERKPPLTPPGRGGLHLPAILAGAALLIMTIAFLAGASGLYATVDGRHLRGSAGIPIDAEVDFTEGHPGWRVVGALVRFYVLTAAFAGSALGGLYLLSRLERRRIGDINLAAVRCLAIVCVSEIALLFGLDYGWGLAEWIVQFMVMAGLFFVGARFFFNVNNQEAAEFGGVAMLLLALFVLIAEVIA